MSKKQAASKAESFVVLDSNAIWNAFAGTGTLAFRALAGLGEAGMIGICIPEMVLREITSQIEEKIAESEESIRKAFDGMRKVSPDSSQTEIGESESVALSQATKIAKDLRRRVEEWIKEANVSVLPIAERHGGKVVDAYFAGAAPFKRKKNRADFPDAFIWEAIRDLVADGTEEIHFVTGDKVLQQNASELGENLLVHPDIHALLKSGALPVVIDELDYKFATALGAKAAELEQAARDLIHSALPGWSFPMPTSVAHDNSSHAFIVEHINALKTVHVEENTAKPLGNNSFSIRFKAEAWVRASYETASGWQEGTFNILKSGSILGDYELIIGGDLFLRAFRDDFQNWPTNAKMEIDSVEIIACRAAQSPSEIDDGEVEIHAYGASLKEAIQECYGLVLIAGRRKKRVARAASVLMNDAARNRPDGLFLVTHGQPIPMALKNVHRLERKKNEMDDDFVGKIQRLKPDSVSMKIQDTVDLQIAQYLAVTEEMLVIGTTEAHDLEELEELTSNMPKEAVLVTAT